ncbi:class I SAM-dependent methyltransferase [Brevibacillus composti]|uniref:Class I SAM-dependent methyltransferase n=1 Tax=Brevibacillus composti TaxID=2796470 RepID=A0A7T5JM71_9BACL|nr:class I SAM-dependent methyltransferase [Brevibacillus composti]QQE72809.1 class I SAM-dependent methyltransferase [Brevibacillus composti]QUO39887.1 class I SAM-dependent methyltransferase [Brevibacillus composti]
MNKADQIKKFSQQAAMYERNRRAYTLGHWRRRLLREARRNVLEAAVGAGANFPFYDRELVDNVTTVDFSPEMLRKAKQAAREFGIPATFLESDMDRLSLAPDSFDTIVSTLSLCSYEDPLAVLNQFNRWCRKDGNILLMEHGLSSNFLLACAQKALDPLIYRIEGCHHNRDMMKIVDRSDLVLVKSEHYWAGCIHLIWAKPSKTQ